MQEVASQRLIFSGGDVGYAQLECEENAGNDFSEFKIFRGVGEWGGGSEMLSRRFLVS